MPTKNAAESDGLSAAPEIADAVRTTPDSAFEYIKPCSQHVDAPAGTVQLKPPLRMPVPVRSDSAMVVSAATNWGFPNSSRDWTRTSKGTFAITVPPRLIDAISTI